MARERAIQIRVSQDEYDAIKANAGERPIGQFLRDLGLRTSLRGGVGGSTGGSEPPGAGSNPAPGSTRPPKVIAGTGTGKTAQGVADDARALTKLTKQLEAQGNPDAEEVARKRLGM